MSLINDMLRDLDQRRPTGAAETLQGVAVAKAPGRNGFRRWGAWSVVLVAVALAVAFGYWRVFMVGAAPVQASPQAMRAPVGEPESGVAASPATAVVSSADANVGVKTQVPEAQEPAVLAITNAVVEETTEGIALKLRAEQRLPYTLERLEQGRQLRLVVPRGELDSPFPDLAGSTKLVNTVSARQVDGDWVLGLGIDADVRAQAVSEDAGRSLVLSLVGPEPVGRSASAEGDQETSTGREPANAESVTRRPATPDSSSQNDGVERKSTEVDGAKQAQAPAPDREAKVEQSFSKDRTASGSASLQRRVEMARRQLERGEVGEAIVDLKAVLDEKASRHEARALLAKAYTAQGQATAAVATLRDGLAVAPEHGAFAMQLARLLAGAGQAADALAVLERHAPSDPSPKYSALIGALSQQTGDMARSAQAYRRALESGPDRAGWWVGLAIAQEGMGEPNEALSSYRKGLQADGLRSALRAYAQQRVERLSP